MPEDPFHAFGQLPSLRLLKRVEGAAQFLQWVGFQNRVGFFGLRKAMNASIQFVGDTAQESLADQRRDCLRRRAFGRSLKLCKSSDRAAFDRRFVEIAKRGPLRRVKARSIAKVVGGLADLLDQPCKAMGGKFGLGTHGKGLTPVRRGNVAVINHYGILI